MSEQVIRNFEMHRKCKYRKKDKVAAQEMFLTSLIIGEFTLILKVTTQH